MKKVILIFIIMTFGICLADTIITGGLVYGTWDLAGSPYIIEDSIWVPHDLWLYIEPGVEVRFNNTDHHIGLTAYGHFEARGEEGDSIWFHPASGAYFGHVKIIGLDTLSFMDYCIVEDGVAIGSSLLDNSGGNVNIQNSDGFRLSHCRLSNGSANYRGGNLLIHDSQNIRIDSCYINIGSAPHGGGAEVQISKAFFNYTYFSNNSGTQTGGGIRFDGPDSCVLTNCTLRSNHTTHSYGEGFGGGIAQSGGELYINETIIENNHAGWYGGGIYQSGSSTTTIINKSEIKNNYSLQFGGGIHSQGNLYLTNTLINGNHADSDERGGGIFSEGYLKSEYCDIVNNRIVDSGGQGGGLWSQGISIFINSIIWGNRVHGVINEADLVGSAACTLSYSCIPFSGFTGTVVPVIGTGCIFTYPEFIDSAAGDFHLDISSPCIDAGTDAGIYDDLEGNTRPSCSGFDIGCYEMFNDTCCIPSNPSPENGAVDIPPPSVTISWECLDGCLAESYDIYFGTDSTSLTPYITGFTDESYIVSGLDSGEVYYWKIISDCGSGTIESPIWHFTTVAAVNIEENENKPELLSLDISPNPFNSAVAITAPAGAEIEIFDIEGRKIGELPGGEQVWKPEPSVGSGIYLVRATVGEQEITKRVVYLK